MPLLSKKAKKRIRKKRKKLLDMNHLYMNEMKEEMRKLNKDKVFTIKIWNGFTQKLTTYKTKGCPIMDEKEKNQLKYKLYSGINRLICGVQNFYLLDPVGKDAFDFLEKEFEIALENDYRSMKEEHVKLGIYEGYGTYDNLILYKYQWQLWAYKSLIENKVPLGIGRLLVSKMEGYDDDYIEKMYLKGMIYNDPD